MSFRLTRHAQEEAARRQVPLAVVQGVLDHPEQVVPERQDRRAYQSRVDFGGKIYLVRVIVDESVQSVVVLTVYRTSKIEKYWSKP